MADNGDITSLFARLQSMMNDDSKDDSVDKLPPIPETLRARSRDAVSRTGELHGERCCIEATEWNTFVLHGARRGLRHLKGFRASFDGEDDVSRMDRTEIEYTLEQVEPTLACDTPEHPAYLIVEMVWPEEADDFFKVAWEELVRGTTG